MYENPLMQAWGILIRLALLYVKADCFVPLALPHSPPAFAVRAVALPAHSGGAPNV